MKNSCSANLFFVKERNDLSTACPFQFLLLPVAYSLRNTWGIQENNTAENTRIRNGILAAYSKKKISPGKRKFLTKTAKKTRTMKFMTLLLKAVGTKSCKKQQILCAKVCTYFSWSEILVSTPGEKNCSDTLISLEKKLLEIWILELLFQLFFRNIKMFSLRKKRILFMDNTSQLQLLTLDLSASFDEIITEHSLVCILRMLLVLVHPSLIQIVTHSLHVISPFPWTQIFFEIYFSFLQTFS